MTSARSSKRGNSLKHRGYRDERKRQRGQLFSLSVLRLVSARRSPPTARSSVVTDTTQQARSTRYRDSADSPSLPSSSAFLTIPRLSRGDFPRFPPERGHTVEKGTANKAGERIRPRLCTHSLFAYSFRADLLTLLLRSNEILSLLFPCK